MRADERYEPHLPLPGVILAAGRSSRMGAPKALLTLDGAPILDRLVAAFRAAGLAPIVVVANGEVLAHARAIEGVVTVEGDAVQPMIDSLARALLVIPPVAGVVVQPVDAAFTSPGVIRALVAGFAGRSRVPVYADQPGHPVVVAASVFSAVRARPEGGLRAVLAAEPAELAPIEDPLILADLDTPEDVAHWTATHGGR